MYKNRKHLVRCNTSIEKKVVVDGVEQWVSDGFVDFEINLDISFIIKVDEQMLNEVFSDMIKEHNTEDLRYEYIDFELVYHFPLKLKGNPVKIYNIKLKEFTDDVKNKLYE